MSVRVSTHGFHRIRKRSMRLRLVILKNFLWSIIMWDGSYCILYTVHGFVCITSHLQSTPIPYLWKMHVHIKDASRWWLTGEIRSTLNVPFHKIHGRGITEVGKWVPRDSSRKRVTFLSQLLHWISSQPLSIDELGVSYFPGVRIKWVLVPLIQRDSQQPWKNDFCPPPF